MEKNKRVLSQKVIAQGEKIAMVPEGKVVPLSLDSEDDIIDLIDVVARFLICEHPAVRVLFKDPMFDNMGLTHPDRADSYRTSAKYKMDDLLDQLLGAQFETEWIGSRVLEIRRKSGIRPVEGGKKSTRQLPANRLFDEFMFRAMEANGKILGLEGLELLGDFLTRMPINCLHTVFIDSWTEICDRFFKRGDLDPSRVKEFFRMRNNVKDILMTKRALADKKAIEPDPGEPDILSRD